MVDCDIVCHLSKNDAQNDLMAFKYDLDEKIDASLEDTTKTESFDEVESNLLIMDNFHPFVMSVKNDKFERTTNFIKDRFRFISRKEIMNEENKQQTTMELSEYYKFNKPDDVAKLRDQKLMNNVFYVQKYGLNYIGKQREFKVLDTFVSIRKYNKIQNFIR